MNIKLIRIFLSAVGYLNEIYADLLYVLEFTWMFPKLQFTFKLS